MYQVEVTYLDNQKDTVNFDQKPSIDLKGNNLYLESSSGQKLAVNVSAFRVVTLKYPESAGAAKPYKFSSQTRFNTKNELIEVLMHSSAPKLEFKAPSGCPNGVVYLKEDDQVLRIISNEWLEGCKIDAFVELAKKK